ncbi:MAG: SDR family NAD(P)-dependent oxidoreductase [Clostridia bacterium]|nr:SDR family NAD(P)-dependent oxidoreductase [Clostridia bacterium]
MNKTVCVITGGGSGMGLAAAKEMPKDKIIVLSGRTVKKLENAVNELTALGYEAHAFACDTAKREDVRALAEYAASLGEIKNVIHAAGLSPAMAKPDKLLRVNALGTVHVNQEFSRLMRAGSVIVDVSSNSAYVLPDFLVGKGLCRLAERNEDKFVHRLLKLCSLVPGGYQKSGLAYALSKKFVIRYAQMCASDYGEKSIRVVSLSPGLIATDMGNLEAREGGKMLRFAAEKRMGTPEELGYALASLADERNGYLAGVDVLCDGGASFGKLFRKKGKNQKARKTAVSAA